MEMTSLDLQIEQSLPKLSDDEKQSILAVIKCFIKLKDLRQQSQPIDVEPSDQ